MMPMNWRNSSSNMHVSESSSLQITWRGRDGMMSQKVLKIYLEKFTIDRMVKWYERIYKQIISSVLFMKVTLIGGSIDLLRQGCYELLNIDEQRVIFSGCDSDRGCGGTGALLRGLNLLIPWEKY